MDNLLDPYVEYEPKDFGISEEKRVSVGIEDLPNSCQDLIQLFMQKEVKINIWYTVMVSKLCINNLNFVIILCVCRWNTTEKGW